MSRIVFDTSVILAYSNDQPEGDEVSGWLRRVSAGEWQGLISAATVAEIFDLLSEKNNEEIAIILINYLKDIGISVVDVDEELARLAGELMSGRGFPGPPGQSDRRLGTTDALVFATAMKKKAVLYTLDDSFDGLGGVDIIGV